MNKLLFAGNCFFSLVLVVLYIASIPSPPNPAEQLELDAELVTCRAIGERSWRIEFPEHMVEQSQVGTELAQSLISISPDLPCEARWDSSTVLICDALAEPKLAHQYHIQLHRPLASLAGRVIADDMRFDLGGEAPRVLDCLPSMRGRHMGIAIRFNMPIDCNNLQNIIHVTDDTDQPQTFSYEIIDPQHVRLDLKQVMHKPMLMHLQIDAGLASSVGPMRMPSNYKRHIQFGKTLIYKHYRSYGDTLTLRFNHALNDIDPQFIKVHGIDDYEIIYRSWGVQLKGAFEPGKQYLLQLREGFPGHGEVCLPQDIDIHAQIADLPAKIDIKDRGLVLSSQALQRLEVESVNLDAADVEVREVYPENYVFLCQNYERLPKAMYGPVKKGSLRFPLQRNKRVKTELKLDAYIPKNQKGLYELRIRQRNAYASVRRLIHVTDIGMYVRINAQDVVVYCSRISDSQAIANASVVIYSKSNQILGTGVSDEYGLCRIKLALAAGDDEPFVAVAKTDDDCAFIDAKRFHVGVLPGAVSGRPYVASLPGYQSAEAYIHVNSGIVRPGTQVTGYVTLRNAMREAMADQDLRCQIYDGQHKIVREETLRLNEVGTCVFNFDLPINRPNEHWTLKVLSQEGDVLGKTGFLVEDFEPERIHLKIDQSPWLIGKDQHCKLSAFWLEGAPATQMPVDVFVRYEKELHPFPEYKEFNFGLVQEPQPGASRPVSGKTDASGALCIKVPTVSQLQRHQFLKAQVLAELNGPSGRPVRAHQEMVVRSEKAYLGVHCQADQLHVVHLDQEGARSKLALDIEVLIEEMDWSYEYHAKRWQWKRVFRNVKTLDLKILSGRLQYDLRDYFKNTWSSYRITVSTKGSRRILASCYRGTSGMWQRPDNLSISTDAQIIPGELIQVQIEAAFNGPAFISLEGVGVHAAQRHDLVKGMNTIEILAPQDISEPNVHLVACQQFPQAQTQNSKHWFVMGVRSLAVQQQQSIQVIESQIPERVDVGSPLAFHLKTSGAQYAYISVVDRGILQITNHRAPNPSGYFHAPRSLHDQTLSTFMRLMQHVRYPSLPGGDGALDALPIMSSYLDTSQEQNQSELVVFQDLIKVPEDGIINYECHLGNYVGRVRCSVVLIATKADHSLAQDVAVSSDFGIRVSTPRNLIVKDQCTLPVTVANRTDEDASLRVLIKLNDKIIRDETHILSSAQRKTLFVQAQAEQVEDLCLHASLLIDEQTVASTEKRITVSTPSRFSQHLIPMYVENIWQPELQSWHEVTSLRLQVHENPLLAAQTSIDELIAYPYGCLEQTTSRCMALLAAYRAKARMNTELGSSDVSYFIESGLRRLQLLRSRDGGLSWWPNNQATAYQYGTLYAYDFILSAHELSFQVPEEFLNQLRDYALSLLRQTEQRQHHCYALYVLARHGEAVRPFLAELLAQVKTKEDLIYLGLAAAEFNDRKMMAKIVNRIDAYEYKPDASRLSSRMRSLVNELTLRKLHNRDDPQINQLVLYIINEYTQRWRQLHTNEKAYLVIGLSAMEQDGADGLVISIMNKGERQSYPLDEQGGIDLDPKLIDLKTLRVHASSPRFVSLSIKGLHKAIEESEDQGLKLNRTMTDVQTGVVSKRLQFGRTYRVDVKIENPDRKNDLAITDVLPSGCAFIPNRVGAFYANQDDKQQVHVEARGQRVHIFPGKAAIKNGGTYTVSYYIRCVYKGRFICLPMTAESMYQPQYRAQLRYARVQQID